MSLLKRLSAALTDLLFPEELQCLCCENPVPQGELLCSHCRNELAALRCAEPTENEIPAVWRYQGPAALLVRDLKLRSMSRCADPLGEGAAQYIGRLPKDTVITWVPASAARLRERGVDHGQLIARAAAEKAGMPCMQLLRRTGERRPQRGLNREQRLHNVEGAFEMAGPIPVRAVLIDDVLTTGATVGECSRVLLAGGVEEVHVVACTRAEKGELNKV